jgi:S-adenosylmethionine decarboxylase
VSADHKASGTHLLADMHGVADSLLRDGAALEALLLRAAAAAGAQVLFSRFHGFGEGGGITGVVLLAESHISIHTWPEHGFAAVDIFMCGDAMPERALTLIEDGLDAAGCIRHNVPRGVALFQDATDKTA